MSNEPPPPLAPPRDRAWVEVRTAALRHNLARVGESAGPDVKLIPMVKADGYGLGVARVVDALAPARPHGYGVATIDEGLELLRLGVRGPVIVCAPVPPQTLPRAVEAGLIPTISDLDSLAALRALAATATRPRPSATAPHPSAPIPHPPAPIPFHLEIDTGMGRAGFPLDPALTPAPSPAPTASDTPSWWPPILSATRPLRTPTTPPNPTPQPPLHLHGIFTHLHSADHPDLASARAQIDLFDAFIESRRRAGELPAGTLVHCANSAAALRLASRTANAARPGIYLYGASAAAARQPPEPVAALRARVLLVRDVPPGATLGYGATYRARTHERWAAVGIGYGDGLPRVLGNRGSAIANGRRLPIIGRISMDTTVVRVSSGGAQDHGAAHDPGAARQSALGPGDIVTFIGCDGGIELPLEEVAEQAGTIPYEILTGLSRRLPRVSV